MKNHEFTFPAPGETTGPEVTVSPEFLAEYGVPHAPGKQPKPRIGKGMEKPTTSKPGLKNPGFVATRDAMDPKMLGTHSSVLRDIFD